MTPLTVGCKRSTLDPARETAKRSQNGRIRRADGRPSCGKFIEPSDVLREVRAANELRKVVIHTITLGEFEKDFMERLAAENGGTFVDLGH